MSVKGEAMPTSMFILCVNMPGQAPLELIDSLRQNVSGGGSSSNNNSSSSNSSNNSSIFSVFIRMH